MSARNVVAIVLLTISFCLLVPGLFKPLLTITASIQVFGMSQEVFRETRSIVQTIESLHESGNTFVAGLIFLFGVVVPLVKGALFVWAMFLKNPRVRRPINRFARAITKWAMNDVFIVAVFVAFLAARATDNLDAEIEVGFYYFAGYCLLSLLSLQVQRDPDEHRPRVSAES